MNLKPLILNIEVGDMPKQMLSSYILNIQEAVSKSFDKHLHDKPAMVFIPTFNGVGKCSLVDGTETLIVLGIDGTKRHIPMSRLIKEYENIIQESQVTE